VKHVVILAALGLTACALPGASGTNSFLGSMHPTQEFCAARQMTLDPATKQCLTPSQQAATAAPQTTGSVAGSPAAGAATGPSPPAQTQTTQPQTAQPQTAQPQTAQPQTAQPQTTQTQTAQAQIAQRQTGQSPSPPATPAVSAQPAASAAPPAPAPAAPLQQERPRTASAMPIEPDAVIYPELRQDNDLIYELAHYVRASGYRCDSVSALQRLSYAHGFKLVCNRFNYKYVIEQKDGRSTVAVE
jgi:hypothetical protein